MPRITISYRREDSGVITGRIFDRLVARYGRDSIFRDIDNIPIGVDFRAHIDRMFNASDIVLAIVGPHWLGPLPSQNRLMNEADPVRIEIEGVLRKGAVLIPVLVLGAAMPTVSDLPESLKDFAYRNAVQLDAAQDFDVHMARLIRAMDGILGLIEEASRVPDEQAATRVEPVQPPKHRRRMLITGGIASIVLGVTIVAGWYTELGQQKSPSERGTGAVAAKVPAPLVPPASAPPSIDAELLFWQSISASNNAADFEEYLRQYPQGRFAGLARNRVTAAPPETITGALPQPASGKCGGSSDEQLIRPIRQVYEAVNTKNIDLYAAQWSDDAIYRSISTGTVRTKLEKVSDRRSTFASWEQVNLLMDKITVAQRAPDRATINVTYSMMIKFYGRPARTQTGVGESYVVICGREGRWLIRENVDQG
jgi:hypothetical protein